MSRRIDALVPDEIAEWMDALRRDLGGARVAQVLALLRLRVPDARALLADSVTTHGVLTESHGLRDGSRSAHGLLTESEGAEVRESSRTTHGVLTECGGDGVREHSVSLTDHSRTTHGEVTDPSPACAPMHAHAARVLDLDQELSPEPEQQQPRQPPPPPRPPTRAREHAPTHERALAREGAGGVVVGAAQCPVDEIVAAFNAVAPQAGFSTLPLTYTSTLTGLIAAAWSEVPDLSVWRAAFARLPECRRELRETARVRSFRQLLEGPSWDRTRRHIWRVLDGELLDTPDGAPTSRTRTVEQSDAERYPWRHGNPEGWVEQPQVSIDDEDLWA